MFLSQQSKSNLSEEEPDLQEPELHATPTISKSENGTLHVCNDSFYFILPYFIYWGILALHCCVFGMIFQLSVLTYLSVLGGVKNLLAKKFWCRNKSLSNWILWIFMAGSTNSPGLGLLWKIKFICNSILSYKGHIKWKYKRNKIIEAPGFTVFQERVFLPCEFISVNKS